KWSSLIKISASCAVQKRVDALVSAKRYNPMIYIKKSSHETHYNEANKKPSILENFVDKTRLNKN
ncbi:hypothetical protein ACODQQ_02370, partial [Enterobacter quasiroggenkampii]|uniref:hypothetical protein n=1 Tax=Enterobacter quasiroggenkampii TaxID=2497436 RepID=UPI003AFF7496